MSLSELLGAKCVSASALCPVFLRAFVIDDISYIPRDREETDVLFDKKKRGPCGAPDLQLLNPFDDSLVTLGAG
jgi:hypothetical protein